MSRHPREEQQDSIEAVMSEFSIKNAAHLHQVLREWRDDQELLRSMAVLRWPIWYKQESRQSTPSSQCSSGTSWKIFPDAGSTRIQTWMNASEIGERRSQRSRKCFDESSAALHAFDVMLHCAERMQCQLPR
ncbi:unnamed protein product [Gongylonema pulchrum]|uniref:Uncharacterized protein n=1 Tax=Gongylonema pulchrum TaxID=637853 RepID=A0A183EMP9_9BILA|nr:unnamed protein product [Gongylonema pulchrum]